jgi:hypothetical protein
MSFASDIQAVTVSSTAQAVQGRTRLQGLIYVSTTTSADLTFRDGGSNGTVRLKLKSPASAGSNDIIIPDDGILFRDGIHITVSNSTHVPSVTLLYVGGQGGNTITQVVQGVGADADSSAVTVTTP